MNVIIIGLNNREFRTVERISQQERFPLTIINGGEIGNGANAVAFALHRLVNAHFVLWRLNRSRYIRRLGRYHPIIIHGVSSALRELRQIVLQIRRNAA